MMHQELHALGACCKAMAATPWRLVRPRSRDTRFLHGLTDAGVPATDREVTLTALLQAQMAAPSPFIAEGVWSPIRTHMGMAAFLVEHPSARFLVDPALCAGAHERVLSEFPSSYRLTVRPAKPVTGLVDALASVGIGTEDIDFVLPTHLHWDHVAGLLELAPELPVHVQAVEQYFALEPATAPFGVARTPLHGRNFQHYELDSGPVLTFQRSHDLFGDGSVVLVDLAGHTPGSIGVLLATTGGRRVLLAGDAAWHNLQITHLREKAPFPGNLVDADRDGAFATLHRLHALPDKITIVPSHDRTAVQSLMGA